MSRLFNARRGRPQGRPQGEPQKTYSVPERGIKLQIGAKSERLFSIARALQHQTGGERTVYELVHLLDSLRRLKVKFVPCAEPGN